MLDLHPEQTAKWLLKEKYHGEVREKDIQLDLERIEKGEPLDYVIGFSDFLGCKIDLTYKPMIPRTETEYWVDQVISLINTDYKKESQLRCLDMFAGSGCIGTAVLKHCDNCRFDFVDLQSNCLKQIEFNLKLNHINPDRYRIIRSDIFSNIGFDNEVIRYDIILANPPYVAESRLDMVQPSVLRHEPHSALFAGPYGLIFIREFLSQAPRYLAPQGRIYLEFGISQKAQIENILRRRDGLKHCFQRDQFKRWRSVWIEFK